MVIRSYRKEDAERLVEIWLTASYQAHDFIPARYWAGKTEDMAQHYLPASQTTVLIQDSRIVGFLSLVEDYLAALFIDVHCQRRGYGKKLLDHAKLNHDTLTLKVFQKNQNALHFYETNGFVIFDQSRDPDTNEAEYVMRWHKSSDH